MTTPVTEALTVTLKPCPFCGGEAKVETQRHGYPPHHWSKCTKCCASTTAYSTKESAITAWNHRHTTPTEPVLRWEELGYDEADLYLGEHYVGCVRERFNFDWAVTLGRQEGREDTLPEAKTAAEQAVRDWLARAGLYTGPNDCGVDRPNAAWSGAEPEQQSALGNASASSDGCGGSTPPPVATDRAGLVRQGGEVVAQKYPCCEKMLGPAWLDGKYCRPVCDEHGYQVEPEPAHPPASPTAEVVEALRRIERLAVRCGDLPDTEGFRRAYRDIAVMAGVALAKVQKP